MLYCEICNPLHFKGPFVEKVDKIKLNDIEGSLKDYNAVEKLIPSYKMVHYIKGKLYIQIKEIDFACEEFEKALKHKVVVADQLNEEYCSSH